MRAIMPRRGVSLTHSGQQAVGHQEAAGPGAQHGSAGERARSGRTPIQLTATNVDCPVGLIADVPDFYRAPAVCARHGARWRRGGRATARLRLMASRFAFPKDSSPRHCTIRLTAAASVVDNVDPTPADNTLTVPITVTTR